ncbi:Potassium transporter [Coniosporium tulheliwenetii]|uniref:Potassium transporter n=1 Tax=Coniosporium tulheliwenetii TaxID=3383036 RepID=A0ACC2YYI0_9PEZI|nr:Potassium transporter [Cladosporium sp. JES 115]
MGCCGDREKAVTEDHKWAYLTLSDFRSDSCWTILSYIWLWILVIISIAVYAADTFTAVNLLAFNKWAGQFLQPVPFNVTKWVFAICIIISWLLLGFEYLRAFRVMRAGGVAESYLDPLAVVLHKKGVDYVALFVYFQFKGAIRIILAEGPRIVINGITLWAAFKSNLAPEGAHAGDGDTSPFEQFFINIEVLYKDDKKHAFVLFTMMFTLVIWVFSAICLIIALILYLLFLWHYIPSSDGRLRNYCRRKIDSRLDRIIGKKTRKALEKQEAKAQKAMRTGQHSADMPPKRQPTLPVLADSSSDSDNASQFTFSTTDTRPTLLPFGTQPPSRTNTPGSVSSETGLLQEHPTLPSIDPRPGAPTRTNTQLTAASEASYTSTISNAPLLRAAGDMGRSDSPTMPLQPRNNQPGPGGPL